MKVGETHDIVIHVNNSIELGLIVKPGTYRIGNAPTFIPKFAVGDPRGTDFTRWRSFVKESWAGGAGQYVYGGVVGNDKFAESHLVDFGVSPTIAGDIVGKTDLSGVTQVRGREVSGALTVAPAPMQNTAAASLASVFTSLYKTFVVPHSNAPHLIHWLTLAAYTNVASPSPFVDIGTPPLPPNTNIPVPSEVRQPTMTGAWVTAGTLASPVISAISHSNVIAMSLGANGIRLYDRSVITPLYSTEAHILQSFDSKLWRTFKSKVAYWNDADGAWSVYLPVGSDSAYILNASPAFGKLYMGKEDSLWAWEAGRIYEVQNFMDLKDAHNFALMVSHRGSLYFNIRDRLYRLSSANLIELLDTPQFNGNISGGAGLDHEVYFMVRLVTGGSEGWVLDTTTGGVRRWIDFNRLRAQVSENAKDVYAPQGISSCLGHIFVAPMAITSAGGTTSPIVSLYKAIPPYAQAQPNFYGMGDESWLMDSFNNFGYPGIDKVLNQVRIDYNLQASGQKIDIYYLTTMAGAGLINAVAEYAAGTTTNGLNAINIFPVASSDYLGSGWTPWERFGVPPSSTNQVMNTNDAMYFGFPSPASFYLISTDKGGPRSDLSQYEYWNGTAWSTLKGIVDETIGTGIAPNYIRFKKDLNEFGTLSFGLIKWTEPIDWKARTFDGVSAYYIRLRATADSISGPRVLKVFSRQTLEGQAWQLLGTINDGTATQAILPFPTNTIVREIAPKYILYGTTASRPEITRSEIEWHPVGPDKNLLQAGSVVLAINNLETLQPGVVENSAAFIAASLFSMNGAGIPYIVQLPYPPPTAHTRRMLVSLAAPGVNPPVLAYDHTQPGSLGSLIETEIPIVLDEL